MTQDLISCFPSVARKSQFRKCTKKACWKLNISNACLKSFWKQTLNFAILILAGTIFNLHHRKILFIRVPEQLWNVWLFRFCFQWWQISCRRWFKESHCDWIRLISQKPSVKVNKLYFAASRCIVAVSIKWGLIASS